MLRQEKIGAVTITFNGEDVIDGFIDSINQQDYTNRILYVVDNYSKDQTISKIEKTSSLSDTCIIKNNFNNGVAGGNNQGIKRALEEGCEYIILINNDTEFEPTLFSKLYEISKKTGYSVIVPKMMYYSEPDILWFAGGSFNKRMGYMNYHIGMGEKDMNQYGDRLITYAPTCCALIHKSVFEDIGLMDEKYFVYFDDTDFWFRMLKDGRHKMFYFSDVHFFHKVGSLTKSKKGTRDKFTFGNFTIKYSTRNRVYYLRKQKTLSAYLNIAWFWFRINLRFFFSGKYSVNFKTWLLIQQSILEGIKI